VPALRAPRGRRTFGLREHNRGREVTQLSERAVVWPARTTWAVTAVLVVVNAILLVVAFPSLHPGDRFFNSVSVVGGLLFASMGLLIVVRARNVIGWILMGAGAIIQLVTLSELYPVVGLRTHPGSLPAPQLVSAILQPLFPLLMVSIAVMLLVYPVGTPPSPRWRPVLWAAIAGAAVSYLGLAVLKESVTPMGGLSFPNPLAIRSLHGTISTALVVVAWVTVLAGVACLWGLVVRFRRGDAELRQQVKWLGFATGGAVACLVLVFASLVACNCDESALATVGFVGFFLFVIVAVPASIAVSVLKYRLYEIDVIIGKAVLYGLLAAFLTAVYVAIVIGVGAVLGRRGNSFLTIVAAVVIAIAFQPVRERSHRLANRVVYGKRATPYEVLSEFSDRVAGTYASEDVLPSMAQILASGTGAVAAHVWLRFGNELREAASWPTDGTALPVVITGDRPADFRSGEHGVEVRHQGELLGALSVAMPPSDPMNPSKAKLVLDLAAQAGLVLRNVRLIEELRASRRRIVTSQDERAKALERNLHDGAQQQLVALAVKQRLAATVVRRDPDRAAEMLEELQTETAAALENLRDLARGIYPPLLADKGLAAALESQARKAAVPTTVESDGVGRYPQEVESAVYFCTLEALNNVAKYAEASRAKISLTQHERGLTFTVADDGVGFDADTMASGTGLQGMRDRLDAIAGKLAVESAPGHGATITGTVPVRSA
jgi:signal transduction histidine kinase